MSNPPMLEAIFPHAMYPYPAVCSMPGINKTRISAERQKGNVLETVPLGRCLFVRGTDLIQFIEAAARRAEKEAAEGDDATPEEDAADGRSDAEAAAAEEEAAGS